MAEAIAEAALKADRTIDRIRGLGLRILTIEDPAYPMRLAAIEMPPHVLYLLGDPAALCSSAAVAIVGTRRATDSGRAIAARIAGDLVAVGASVVSGLAVGIDGAAHAATLHARGTTVAVIGSGHADIHPRAHQRLAAAIVAGGGAVVSELAPDIKPSQGTFPRRNRIISGLADATVVVEAPARSGALITASWALEQGRGCFLVPGAIGAPASAGCLAFLREFPDNARIVAGIPQLIDDLGLADHLAEPGVSNQAAATLADVGAAAGRLGRELVLGRATVDELVAATGWPVASVLAGLTLLERRGLAVGIHGRFRPAGSLALADPATFRQRPRARRLRSCVRPAGGPRGLPEADRAMLPFVRSSSPMATPSPLGATPRARAGATIAQGHRRDAGRPDSGVRLRRCAAAPLGDRSGHPRDRPGLEPRDRRSSPSADRPPRWPRPRPRSCR